MRPVSLALFWHQHQPYYPDDVSGETLMPWVRLHGTKDYYGMALHLLEVPEFHCTINLVPSLLLQLERYTKHGGSDRHLDVSRMPADSLSTADATYLLDHFFMANLDNMVRPYPRYFELYLQRGFNVDSAEHALARFQERDLRDLQVWNNLTWFHPLAFERDAELREFLEKGRHWSEEEKLWLLDKQLEILSQIIPLHRQLAESGQVELTTTPFYHPILPLLWDQNSAHEAMPGCPLPRQMTSYAEDARLQLRRAIEYHEELFGMAPRGMWPSEGSVSQDILPAIAEVGIEWIATDEEILSHSTNHSVARDGQGHIRNPEMLFRPWLVGDESESLQIVFRDHALSDLIGFHYQRSNPVQAADDLLAKVEAIGRAVESRHPAHPPIVPIILDGENCWEYYPDGGVEFLRSLYQKAARHERIRPSRIVDHLDQHPASHRISHLFAGSWISHNFAIWIGHHEDVTAWELLHETREFLVRKSAEGGVDPQALERAWEELYIAEGSDWYWWFGDDHSSALDSLFDQLFRKHLMNVYRLLGEHYPSALSHPITNAEAVRVHSEPTGFLDVKVDGRQTFFEWITAGFYQSGSERGTMTQVTQGVIERLYFGFDPSHLLLRVDTQQAASEDLGRDSQLVLQVIEPVERSFVVEELVSDQPRVKIERGQTELDSRARASCGSIVEMMVPLDELEVSAEERLVFVIEIRGQDRSLDRAPQEGTIDLVVPSLDFEMINWQA